MRTPDVPGAACRCANGWANEGRGRWRCAAIGGSRAPHRCAVKAMARSERATEDRSGARVTHAGSLTDQGRENESVQPSSRQRVQGGADLDKVERLLELNWLIMV